MDKSNLPKTASGADGPLDSTERPIDASYFHGSDGLGDVDPLDPGYISLDSTDDNEEKDDDDEVFDAASAIIRECDEAEAVGEEVVLITLGPLTNLSVALDRWNSLSRSSNSPLPISLAQVWIMGGCANGRGNATRSAEFNVLADPEGASRALEVLQSTPWSAKVLTTVVSWECCCRHPLPWSFFDSLIYSCSNDHKEKESHTRSFIAAISKKTFPPRHLTADNDSDAKRGSGAVICDALAVACALRPELVKKFDLAHVEVEREGKSTRGMTVCDFGHSYDGVDRPRGVRWVTDVDIDGYTKVFTELV